MEGFKTSSLLTADSFTFVIWPHGQTHLLEFLDFLYGQQSTIKFTMEQEQGGKISFLDVQLSKNPDGTLKHSIYCKPTHTDRYLKQRSFHHPAIKSSVNHALVRWAYQLCDR